MIQKWSNNFHSNCRNTFWTLTNCPLSFVTFDYTRKKRPELFFHWKDCLFLSKVCVFQQPLRCYRSEQITSTVVVRIPFGPLQIFPWGLSDSIIREKQGQNNFFLERLPFFSKLYVFQQLLRCYRSDLITCTKNVGIFFGPLQTVPWVLSPSIIREKSQNLFFTRKIAFFQKFVFNNLLDSLKFDLITSAVRLKLPRGLLQSVLWDLSYSITRL